MSLAKLFVRHWKVPRITPRNPDVVVAICYGVLPDRLADGTEATLEEAIWLARRFGDAKIAFGNATICFPGSEDVERREKMRLIERRDISAERIIDMPIVNSVTEATRLRDVFEKLGLEPREITIVAAEAHSRSVMYIFRRVFPGVRLSLVHVPFETEYQPDHTVTLQTRPWLWIAANIARHLALVTLGLERVGRVTHHTEVR